MASRTVTSHISPLSRFITFLLCLSTLYSTSLAILIQTYCSDQNTGTSNLLDTTIYESLGNCQTKCRENFAFAIVQGQDCWCSNFAPSNQLAVNKCSDKCLGYPYENCGNSGSNLFGYLALDKPASGTSSVPVSTPTPITSPTVQTTLRTVSGSVVTATVTVMPTGQSSGAEKMSSNSKMSSGSVVAIAVAVVVASIVLLAALIIGWCCWRRKKSTSQETSEVPQRNPSVLSKAGLLGTVGIKISEPSEHNSPVSERRNSRPLVVDQRLNPNAFMMHDDTSHSSFVSMQDNHDYTRTLNIRNPDP